MKSRNITARDMRDFALNFFLMMISGTLSIMFYLSMIRRWEESGNTHKTQALSLAGALGLFIFLWMAFLTYNTIFSERKK